MLKISIRCDASSKIGTGHFMRCLTLADSLAKKGCFIRFIFRYIPDYLRYKLVEKGHDFLCLPVATDRSSVDELAHANWLGVSQQQDAENTIQALSDKPWDWLVVDHYALDARWEFMIREHVACKILVIDDIADRTHDCDILLDQNLYSNMDSRYTGKVPMHTQLLLGPRYALLRDEFSALHQQIKPRQGSMRRILVFFGGVDNDNYTGKTLDVLSQLEGIHVDVVIGIEYPFHADIQSKCVKQDYTCHTQTNSMGQLIADADLAIGAGGSTIWEYCCLGLPALVFCMAKNQEKQLEHAAQALLIYSPDIGSCFKTTLHTHLLALLDNHHLRMFMSSKGLTCVSGQGVHYALSAMALDVIDIREAVESDSKSIFSWRNHEKIRKVSHKKEIISWQDHKKWFHSILAEPKKKLLIGEHDGKALGVVRFDVNDDCAEISIYLVPEKMESKRGLSLLRNCERWLALHCPEIRIIRAYVLAENQRSKKFFSKAGYQCQSTEYIKRVGSDYVN